MKIIKILSISCLLMGATIISHAQTSGDLSFSVTTTSTGNFSPRHAMAIWIEKADGTFVKTKLKRAASRVQYLNTWIAKSVQNVVDATTSATINTHQTETILWNATDVSGNIVADGDYKVWIQMAWANTNGPTTSILFTKSATGIHLTPTSTANYTNMTLDWVPSASSIANAAAADFTFSATPNPFRENTSISFSIQKQSNVTINIYSMEGQWINSLCNGNKPAGDYTLLWNGADQHNQKVDAGIYYVSVSDGEKTTLKKIIKLN